MPTKFRKNIWVKRGDYIVVEPIAEGDKIKAEIVKILNKDSMKYYKENNVWPKEFTNNEKYQKESHNDIFVNTNRVAMNTGDSDRDTSSGGSESGNESDLEQSGDEKQK